MTCSDLIKEVKSLSKKPIKKPKCFRDDNFMYCYCEKCEADNYELPSDFKRILAIKLAKKYNNPD